MRITIPFKTDDYDNVVEEFGSKKSTAMIKVPFDTDGNHGTSMRGEILNSSALRDTLDNAYKTMPWFKYLADHAIEINMLEKYYDARAHMTTHVVGFELEGKHETFYRMKYSD